MERRTLKNEPTVSANTPAHYQHSSVDPLTVIASMGDSLAFYRANIVKYLMRYQHSEEPIEDLDKLIDYATRLREAERELRSNG